MYSVNSRVALAGALAYTQAEDIELYLGLRAELAPGKTIVARLDSDGTFAFVAKRQVNEHLQVKASSRIGARSLAENGSVVANFGFRIKVNY